MHKLASSTKDSNSWALGSIILDSNVARAFIQDVLLWGVRAAKAQGNCAGSGETVSFLLT